MKITPVPHGIDLLSSDLVRSPGLHVSDMYGAFYQELEPNRFKVGTEPNPLLMALGTAWENHLEFLLGKSGVRVLRPGELLTAEGIAYSPDGLIEDDDSLAEYKLSSMGTKDLPTEPCHSLPPKFEKYACQMMTYCFHLGTNKARLYFCSIYRPYQPELIRLDIEFTDRELKDNWKTLLNYARNKNLL